MSPSPSPALPAPSEEATKHALVTVVVMCIGGLSAALTQTLVIPIQSELPKLLSTTAANASWVITATLLAAAVTMPVAGRLGDMFGKQRIVLLSAATLLVGSVVCALSNSLTPMLAGRVLQGMAMGFIPVGISLMREVTPPHMTATAIASMSATLGVGGAIGLPLAAWIAQDYSWHALFWFSAVLAALVTAAVAVFVPRVKDATGGRFDIVGMIGLGVGLVAVLIGISKANEWGWGSGRTVGSIVAGVVVLLVWGAWELRQKQPLVDLRVSARRPILLTNVAAVAVGFGMMAQSIVMPQLLQLPKATGYGLGQTLLASGLWMAPAGIMTMIFAPVSSTLIGRVGAKITLMVGATVLSAGYVVSVFLMGAPWQLLIGSCVATAGVGIAYAAMPTLILNNVPLAESGAAVGLNSLMRSVGTSVASAVMITLLTSSTRTLGGFEIPTQGAYRLCFVFGAAAALIGVVIVAFVPRRERPAPVAATEGDVVTAGASV